MGTRSLLVTDIFGGTHRFWVRHGVLLYGGHRARVTWALVQHSGPNVCIFFCLAGEFASGESWVHASGAHGELQRELTCPDLARALARAPCLPADARAALGVAEVRRGDFVRVGARECVVPAFDGVPPRGVYVEPLTRCEQRALADFFDSVHRDMANLRQCTLPRHLSCVESF